MSSGQLATQTDWYTAKIIEAAWYFDSQYIAKLDVNMCTEKCPCFKGTNNIAYKNYMELDETTYVSH